MDTCSLYFLNWVCCLEAAVTQSNVWDSLVWFMYRKRNVMQNTDEKPQIRQTSTGQPGPHQHEQEKKILRWFQQIPKAPGISCRVGPIPWNKTSQYEKKKNSKNRWKSREWVQLEVKTRARQLKKHISREFVGPWLSAMRAKQTRRPGLTTSASVHLQGLLWKPWTREDSAERIGRGAVTETQNKRPIFLQTYYIFKKFVS